MTVYGGIETKEITDLIEEIENELQNITESEFDCGRWEVLAFTYKRLMKMVYIEEYCLEKFKELRI